MSSSSSNFHEWEQRGLTTALLCVKSNGNRNEAPAVIADDDRKELKVSDVLVETGIARIEAK
jgi:hypothetical protein